MTAMTTNVFMAFACAPNAPAQARRGNDVRLLSETRSRRCLQPAGSAIKHSWLPPTIAWRIGISLGLDIALAITPLAAPVVMPTSCVPTMCRLVQPSTFARRTHLGVRCWLLSFGDHSSYAERPELRHAGPTSVNREAELRAPSRVACSDLLDHVMFMVICQSAEYPCTRIDKQNK